MAATQVNTAVKMGKNTNKKKSSSSSSSSSSSTTTRTTAIEQKTMNEKVEDSETVSMQNSINT